jgi:BirA family biotin operon repressor/biotin-[acetyl-CoA-carboxylase] ligase
MVIYVYYKHSFAPVKQGLSGRLSDALSSESGEIVYNSPMSSSLDETSVQSALRTRWLGHTYYHFDTIDSTNSTLREMWFKGSDQIPPAGTVVQADYQTHGRGRFNRQWLAPAGSSLLLSILFRPQWTADKAQWLTMIASLAAAEAIEALTHLVTGLKWPNDLVVSVDGSWHKVGGLLLEGNVHADARLRSVMVGVGINVNISSEELPETEAPITSLMIQAGSPISRLRLLVEFLARLETLYEGTEKGISPQPAWKQRLITLGKAVQVTRFSDTSPLSGVAEDADDWGRLLVKDSTGRLHQISAADVTLRD